MPELPDVTVYLEALERRIRRAGARARAPAQPVPAAHGRSAAEASRGHRRRRRCGALGKRIAIGFDRRSLARDPPDDRRPPALVADAAPRAPGAHRASRLRLRRPARSTLTEAGTKRRASLHVVRGSAGAGRARSGRPRSARRRRSTRSVARSPRRTTRSSARSPIRTLFSGIGNAYSDEILHRARLSPVAADAASSTRRRVRNGCTTRRSRCSPTGSSACAQSGRRLPGEGHRLPHGHGRARPLRQAVPGLRHAGAAHSSTQTTRPTTARAARPAASCSPTARCRGCSRTTGRRRSRRWKTSGSKWAIDRSCTARIAPGRRSTASSSSCGTGKAYRPRTRRIG